MKYIVLFFAVFLYPPVFGQPNDMPNRKLEFEILTETMYTATEFQRIADSLQMSVSESSCYLIISPIRYSVILPGFGNRRHPIYKRIKFHTRIDFAELKGTPVYATGSGVVIRKGYNSGHGNFIEIQHADVFHSFYAHLSKTLVNAGDSASMGKYIASVSNRGITTGYHLHYEIRKSNRFLNPMEWCWCLVDFALKQKCREDSS